MRAIVLKKPQCVVSSDSPSVIHASRKAGFTQRTNRSFFFGLVFTLVGYSTLYSVPFGGGVAKYGPPRLPDDATIHETEYLPTTDDAAGIQAAIDTAHTAGGGTVQLLAKTYLVDTAITIKSGIQLRGQGMGKTVLKRDSSYTSTVPYFVGAVNGAVTDAVISHLTVDRDFSRQDLVDNHETVLLGIGIRSSADYYNERIRLDHVEAIGFTVGLSIEGATHITVVDCRVHDNGGTVLHHNIYFRRTGRVLFSGNHVYDSVGGSGIKLSGGTTNVAEESRFFTIRNNKINRNESINLNIQGCHHLLIEGNLLQGQISTDGATAGLFLRQYKGYECRYSDIINNYIIDNTGKGLYAEGCRTFSIEGNACFGNGTDYNLASNIEFSCDYNTAAPRQSLELWRFQHFQSFFDTGDAADSADPDLDSQVNLLEYATGTDPTAPSPAAFLIEPDEPTDFKVRFTRIADPALNYFVEGTNTLPGPLSPVSWDTIWSGTGTSAGSVTVSDATWAGDATQYFLRLRVRYLEGFSSSDLR